MNKVLKGSILIILCATLSLAFIFLSKKEYMKIEEGIGALKVEYRGIKGGNSFDFDEQGNVYIATNNSLETINKSGEVKKLFKEKGSEIYSLRYLNNKIYFLDRCYLKSFDLENKKIEILMDNIPNYGEYKEGKIIAEGKYIYISIGAVTNSAIAEKKYKEGMIYDLTPREVTLNGENFGEEATGPFLPYGSSGKKGQVINANFPGNASVIKYDLNSKKGELYCWGIKNIQSFDVNSKGDIYSIVGGFENRGPRAIREDVDYIYKLEFDRWYGWPDYSGGEPINSELFTGVDGEKVEFILDNHPAQTVPKPMYEHNEVSSLKSLVIDKEKELFKEEKIYFYDKNLGAINSLDFNGSTNLLTKFKSKDQINDLRVYDNKLYGFNQSKGIIFSLDLS